MDSLIKIGELSIRQDDDGRYCINDLHRAAGGEARHKPGNWLQGQQPRELAAELEKAGIPAIQSKQGLGTFVCKELVYAYAMWISPKFHVKVIRAYDAMMEGREHSSVRDRRRYHHEVVDASIAHRTGFGQMYRLGNVFMGVKRLRATTKHQVADGTQFMGRVATTGITQSDHQRIETNAVDLYGEPEQLSLITDVPLVHGGASGNRRLK
nr:hypothetical protein HUO10_003338 [Paraburkholderia busanensis]